jgi:hypothetical protein
MQPQRFLDRRSPPHIATLVVLSALGALAMNLFLPALPEMARHFGVSAGVMQLSVSGFLAANAVLQLLVGPLSDRFGRRPVVLGAVIVFLLASLGTLEVLIDGPGGRTRVLPYVHPACPIATSLLPPHQLLAFGAYIGASPGLGSHFREPGDYTIHARLRLDGRVLAQAEPASVTIRPPPDAALLPLGPQVLAPQASRVFRFQGSHVLHEANAALDGLRAALAPGEADSLARHLALVAANPFDRPRRVREGGGFRRVAPDLERAMAGFEAFLGTPSAKAASAAINGGQGLYGDVLGRYRRATLVAGQPERLDRALQTVTEAARNLPGGAALPAVELVLERARRSVLDFDPTRLPTPDSPD